MLSASLARRAFSGFFLSGVLLAFLGAILPAWGHHVDTDYLTIGAYFLALNVGLLCSVKLADYLLRKRSSRWILVAGCGLASFSLVVLAATPAAVDPLWRLIGLFLAGLSAGLVNKIVFQGISAHFRHDPASTVNLAGAFFGIGCLLTAVLVAGTFRVYTVPSILIFLALIPGFLAGLQARWVYEPPALPPRPSWRQVLADFKSPGALMFSLLLFFQFGNEWSVAGWLALYLIQMLGVSPEASLKMLSLYWLTLLVARAAFQWLLPRVPHGRLLTAAVLATMFGCVLLLFTNNLFGAGAGIVLMAAGFAAVYPLVVEKIGDRFPYYHPGFFNGIFSFALTGGLLAPCTLGLYVHLWGVRVVMLLPLLGTCMVFLLLVLIWLYAKLTEAPQVTAGAD